MAQGKKKVIWYTNWGKTFAKLSDEEAGKLIKHFCAFVMDEHPEAPDRMTEILFEQIQDTLERDLELWKKQQHRNRENGKKGGRPKKTEENPKKPTGLIQNPQKGVIDTVTVIDKDSVNVNDNNILLKKEPKKKFNFKKHLVDFGFDSELLSEWLEIRRKKKAVNSLRAAENFIREIKKTGRPPNEVLKIIVNEQWKGFKSEWLNNLQNETNKANSSGGNYKTVSTDFSNNGGFG